MQRWRCLFWLLDRNKYITSCFYLHHNKLTGSFPEAFASMLHFPHHYLTIASWIQSWSESNRDSKWKGLIYLLPDNAKVEEDIVPWASLWRIKQPHTIMIMHKGQWWICKLFSSLKLVRWLGMMHFIHAFSNPSSPSRDAECLHSVSYI